MIDQNLYTCYIAVVLLFFMFEGLVSKKQNNLWKGVC